MATFELPAGNSPFVSKRYFPRDGLSNPWAAENFDTPESTSSPGGDPFSWEQQRSSEHARVQQQHTLAASNERSPGGACPIRHTDWRSSSAPVTQEFVIPRAEGSGLNPGPLNLGAPASACAAASSSPSSSSCSPSPPHSTSASSARGPRAVGLREQLLRASSIPPPAAQDFPEAGPASQQRRKSLSFLGSSQSPSEQHLQQQLSHQLHQEEEEWRKSEAQAAAATAAAGEAEETDNVWFDEAHAEFSECINFSDVQELCASMDIAGMKVEDVDIFCPPCSLLPPGARDVDHVLLSVKFEGMTLRHYPGNHQAKMLFSQIIGA